MSTLQSPTPARPEWLAPVSSAILPGMGQLLRHRDRGVVYLVAEAFFLQRFVAHRTEARREEDRYKALAFQVARGPFAPIARDTIFEYFEQMGVFVESGPYDTDPGPALAPPADESTYNGSMWLLARQTFFQNPNVVPDAASNEYQSALSFYRKRAVGPNFQWSWKATSLQRDQYQQGIVRGDDSFRRASTQLGFLLANHFLSMVDAFVSQRLTRKGPAVGLEHHVRGSSPQRFQVDIGIRIQY